jgi:hypothetical protein
MLQNTPILPLDILNQCGIQCREEFNRENVEQISITLLVIENLVEREQALTNEGFVYSAGQMLKGRVSFRLSTPCFVDRISISLIATAVLGQSSDGLENGIEETATFYYHDFKVPEKLKDYLFPANVNYFFYFDATEDLLESKFAMMESQSTEALGRKLQVSYRLSANVNDVSTSYPVIVKQCVLPNREFLSPLSLQNEKKVLFSKGKVAVQVVVPKRCFALGESIPLHLNFENSTAARIKGVTVALKAVLHGPVLPRCCDLTLKHFPLNIRDSSFNLALIDVYIPFTFHDGSKAVPSPPSIPPFDFSVKYWLSIQIHFPGLTKRMILSAPLTILSGYHNVTLDGFVNLPPYI